MALSDPEVLSASIEELIASASVTSAAVIFSVDTSKFSKNFQSIAVHATAWGTGTATAEVSNDGTNWVSVAGYIPSNVGSVAMAATFTAVGVYLYPLHARYFRLRVSAYTSGTMTAQAILKTSPIAPLPSGAGQTQTVTATVAGATLARSTAVATAQLAGNVVSAATTNPVLVKGAPGVLYGWALFNKAAAPIYLKIYDKATLPTVGTDTPLYIIGIPAGQRSDVSFGPQGIGLATGIAYGIVTGVANSDTTAPAANDLTGMIVYG